MKIDIYSLDGKVYSTEDLNPSIFSIEPNLWLMHRYLVYQRSNSRYNLAHTKTRWEVRWWWRKPFKQKWTWRARQGSTRSPNHVKGWIAHWPRANRNFSILMPKKMRRLALFSYLSQKAQEKNIIWLKDYNSWVNTKEFLKTYSSLPINRNALFVVSEKNDDLLLSSRNLKDVKVVLVNYLNPLDITKYQTICFVWDSFKKIDEVFLSKN